MLHIPYVYIYNYIYIYVHHKKLQIHLGVPNSRAAAGADWIFLEYLLIFSNHLSAFPGSKDRSIESGQISKVSFLGDSGRCFMIQVGVDLHLGRFPFTNQNNNTRSIRDLAKLKYFTNQSPTYRFR